MTRFLTKCDQSSLAAGVTWSREKQYRSEISFGQDRWYFRGVCVWQRERERDILLAAVMSQTAGTQKTRSEYQVNRRQFSTDHKTFEMSPTVFSGSLSLSLSLSRQIFILFVMQKMLRISCSNSSCLKTQFYFKRHFVSSKKSSVETDRETTDTKSDGFFFNPDKFLFQNR